MKKVYFLPSFILLVVFSCVFSNSQKNELQYQSVTPYIKIDPQIPDSFHTSIKNAVFNYFTSYPGAHIDSISIESMDDSLCSSTEQYDEMSFSPLVYGKPKHIFLCQNSIPHYTAEILYYIMSHQLYHAIPRDTVFVTPYTVVYKNVQYTVLGYYGLSLYVKTYDGRKTFLRVIEEASAEISARLIVREYKATSPLHVQIGNILADIGRGKFRFGDLVLFQKNSDFISFCGKILQKKREHIEQSDIQRVLNMFSVDTKKNKYIDKRFQTACIFVFYDGML